jgi:L-rhamnose mutarotase
MPYLEIDNYPIFISRDRNQFFLQELFDDSSKRVATS